ncbi:MAG: iron-sulfur cluster assembly protein, partial [Mesorhizobium sp.]
MSVTREAVVERLRTVTGPDFTGNIVDLGLVSEIFIADAKVFFSVTVPAARANEMEPLRAAAERVVKAIPGVANVMVALTAEKKGGGMESAPPPRPALPPQRPAAQP